jgi:hypothetical protein
MIIDLIRNVLDAQQALHMARFSLWREDKAFAVDAMLIDHRANRWGINDETLYVARPLELAEETHVLCSGEFDMSDVYDVPETNITIVRVRDPINATYLFSRDRRDDHYFRGECGVLSLCDASGRFVKNMHFAPSLLMQRKPRRNHPFIAAMRLATGLSDLEFEVTPLQNAARNVLFARAFVCQYENEGRWSTPDLYIVRQSDDTMDHIRSVVEYGGRVLDPRTIPGLISADDVTLT